MNFIIPYVISILLSVAVAVYPVKLTAKAVAAGKSDFLTCLIAVVFSVIIATAVSYIFPNILIAVPIAIGVVGFVYESVLDTSIKNGVLIALVAVLIKFVVSILVLNSGLT